jgi:hypothetical protein
VLDGEAAGMRAWLLGGDGAFVVRGKGVGFVGLAGGETGVVDVRLELGPGGVLGYRWGNECNTARADGGEDGRGVAGISTAQRRKRRKQVIHRDAQQEEERRDALEGCWSV